MKLWFENVWGEERVIANHCNTWDDVCYTIDNFIKECNRKWPDKKPFEWYYTRTWEQKDGRTRIDIGSHSEFFIWEGKFKSATIINKDGEVEFEYE